MSSKTVSTFLCCTSLCFNLYNVVTDVVYWCSALPRQCSWILPIQPTRWELCGIPKGKAMQCWQDGFRGRQLRAVVLLRGWGPDQPKSSLQRIQMESRNGSDFSQLVSQMNKAKIQRVSLSLNRCQSIHRATHNILPSRLNHHIKSKWKAIKVLLLIVLHFQLCIIHHIL